MHETQPDRQFLDPEHPAELSSELVTDPVLGDIRDILMLQTALLMRLYDVNMLLLGHVDEETASELWEKHNAGGHNNPAVMVPVFSREEENDEASSS